MSSRSCPDWPDLMEIAPELQFKHYTVAEAQLPADALMQVTDFSLADVAICADLDKRRLLRGAHGRARRRGAPPEPLVRDPRVGQRGPAWPGRLLAAAKGETDSASGALL